MENSEREFISDTYVCDRSLYESTQPDSGKRGILRTIKGPIAEWDNLNRNKRKYTEKLWDKTLASPYVIEQMKYKTLYGEANHPTDRYEVDFSRVSHSITEMWKVPASNQIFATINILDTPLARIINTLYEAGGVIGYSTRAGGSLIQRKGYVEVDENTYNFVTVDAVPYPSVESARPPIVEGVEQEVPKKELGTEVHEKLCNIIKESTEESREVIKSLIYSLESYDMTKEKELLESSSNIGKNEPDEETTLSLLKGSSLQIDNLKAVNQTLRAEKESLIKENATLKESLNSSVENITKLANESKMYKESIAESETRFDDTFRELKSQIQVLEGTIEEKNMEIDCLIDVEKAAKALRYENMELKSNLESHRDELVESASIENTNLQKELDLAYKEISKMVSESSELEDKIKELNESVELYKSKILSMEEEIKQVNENFYIVDEKTAELENKEAENTRLRKDIDSLNESIDSIKSKSEYYRDSLVSVICSGYNLTVESVMRKLPVGFTKSDIYCVCEEMSNSVDSSVDYTRVINESIDTKPTEKRSSMTPKLDSSMWSNRRGLGKI